MTPEPGERFYYDGAYFVLRQEAETGLLYFEAEAAGEDGERHLRGHPGGAGEQHRGADFGDVRGHLRERQRRTRATRALRNRVIEKIAGPAENGNKQHYKTWCESIDGVGRARIFPLWLGENTVKAVLIDTTGKPCGEAKVLEVQELHRPGGQGHDGDGGRQDLHHRGRPSGTGWRTSGRTSRR